MSIGHDESQLRTSSPQTGPVQIAEAAFEIRMLLPSTIVDRLDHLHQIVFDPQRGKHPGLICSRIDPDPVRQNRRAIIFPGVTVHDHRG